MHARRSLTFGFFFCLCLALFGNGLGAKTKTETVDILVRFFDTVVFGAEIDQSMASKVVAKWQEPLKIFIHVGDAKQKHANVAAEKFKLLSKLTGLKAVQTRTAKRANFHLIFVRRSEMAYVKIGGVSASLIRKLATNAMCYFITAKKPPSKIVKAFVVADVDLPDDKLHHCLLEEITQTLGLPNDTTIASPSLFDEQTMTPTPTTTDQVVIRTLYDKRMKPGLKRAEALEVAREIITEMVVAPAR